jgi:hypothetical protein
MSIERNVYKLEQRIARASERSGRSPSEITLVAATKTIASLLIHQAFEAGIRHFGENRVQEAKDKIDQVSPLLKPPPTWHMIGRLQRNKARTAVEIFDIIQSIDSFRLAQAVSNRASRVFTILLEVNVSGEASKAGFSVMEVPSALKQISCLPNLEVKGLMTVAPLANNPEEVRPIFRQMRQLRDSLGLEHLSMGMSDDFEVAIEEGATIVRIGRAIFGEREG